MTGYSLYCPYQDLKTALNINGQVLVSYPLVSTLGAEVWESVSGQPQSLAILHKSYVFKWEE